MKIKTKKYVETFKTHLLREDSIKTLYQSRLNQLLENMPISNNINLEWENIKSIILKAAEEALGQRKKRCKG